MSLTDYWKLCQYCGKETPTKYGDICEDCRKKILKCPISKPGCRPICLYLKGGLCDYPFIGRVRAEPDKVME